MNKDFERCCSFLADMIIKYAPEIKEEVEVCMMIKDSIDDEKVSRQKQFDRFCYYLGGVKQLLDEKAVYAASILQIICCRMYTYIRRLHSWRVESLLFCIV